MLWFGPFDSELSCVGVSLYLMVLGFLLMFSGVNLKSSTVSATFLHSWISYLFSSLDFGSFNGAEIHLKRFYDWMLWMLFSAAVFARGLRLSEEQCNQTFNRDTSVISFVASGRGDGLRSLAVVSYLCDIQNQFMEDYSRLTGHRYFNLLQFYIQALQMLGKCCY